MDKQQLTDLILQAIPQAQVILSSDDNVHFQGVIVAEQFASLSPVKRQQLVYGTVSEYIANGQLHAFSFKTYTLKEWQTQGAVNNE